MIRPNRSESRTIDPHEGIKDDTAKLRFDLIPAQVLEDLARVYTVGAEKYADRNWEKGISWGRVFAAIMRHLWAFWKGEDNDPEDGLPHTIHAAWGCFALTEYMRTCRRQDDRPCTDPLSMTAWTPQRDLYREFYPHEEERARG